MARTDEPARTVVGAAEPEQPEQPERAAKAQRTHKAKPAGQAPRAPRGVQQHRGVQLAGGQQPRHGSGDEAMIKQRVAPPRATADTVLLTFKEAMDFLRVSRSTLYRLMWSGQLRGHKVGSTWRFYESDLLDAVASPAMGMSVVEQGASPEGRE